MPTDDCTSVYILFFIYKEGLCAFLCEIVGKLCQIGSWHWIRLEYFLKDSNVKILFSFTSSAVIILFTLIINELVGTA